MDWKSIIRSVAPSIATALGGPMAGVAVAAASKALLPEGKYANLKDKPEELARSLQAAVQGASPGDLMKLKQADQDFQAKLAELGVDLEKVHAEDRGNARKREISVGGYATPILGGLVILGFLTMAGYVIGFGLPETSAPAAYGMVGTVVGYVSAKADQVVSYYFGSSSSSAEKNSLLKRAMR